MNPYDTKDRPEDNFTFSTKVPGSGCVIVDCETTESFDFGKFDGYVFNITDIRWSFDEGFSMDSSFFTKEQMDFIKNKAYDIGMDY